MDHPWAGRFSLPIALHVRTFGMHSALWNGCAGESCVNVAVYELCVVSVSPVFINCGEDILLQPVAIAVESAFHSCLHPRFRWFALRSRLVANLLIAVCSIRVPQPQTSEGSTTLPPSRASTNHSHDAKRGYQVTLTSTMEMVGTYCHEGADVFIP